jgi:hypothetical protein
MALFPEIKSRGTDGSIETTESGETELHELIVRTVLSGGPCRIRTHVSGSEGRKDIQTTLTVHAFSQRGRPIFNAPDGRAPLASIGSCGP